MWEEVELGVAMSQQRDARLMGPEPSHVEAQTQLQGLLAVSTGDRGWTAGQRLGSSAQEDKHRASYSHSAAEISSWALLDIGKGLVFKVRSFSHL